MQRSMMLSCSPLLLLIAHLKSSVDGRRLNGPITKLLDDVERPASNKCGYNKEDIYDPAHDVHEWSVLDPRVTIRQHGWRKGLWAKLMMVSRGMIQTKVVSLELSGVEGYSLTQAMYGIVTTKVPEKCFPLLKEVLPTESDFHCTKTPCSKDMTMVKERKRELLKILKKQLPKGCDEDNPPPKDDPEIKRVQHKLWPLLRGYWGLHEPLTVENRSELSVRVLDELRVLRNNTRVRQVWFYGKTHIMQYIEFTLRQQLLAARKNRIWSEESRLSRQIMSVCMLVDMADAHLEFVELDGAGSCMSATKYDPEPMFARLRSEASLFRVMLMFRERHWQSRTKAVARFFQHPVLSMKKTGIRFADQFVRSPSPPMKIGMVLKPLMKIAVLAGVVLGSVTLGTTTFAVLFADTLIYIGIELAMASLPFIQYLVNEAVGIATQPLKDYLTLQVMTTTFSAKQTQYIISFMDKVPRNLAFAEVTSELYSMVERIITDDKVRQEIEDIRNSPVDANDEDAEASAVLKENIEDEVRRYVQDMVFQGFVQDTVPAIQKEFFRRLDEEDPSFGWLSWKDWETFRTKEDSEKKITRKFANKMLRYKGDSNIPPWQGKVIAVANKLPGQRRKLTVEIQEGDLTQKVELTRGIDEWYLEKGIHMTVELTSRVKSLMSIRDPEAFRRSQAGWLRWYDWAEYRNSRTTGKLKGKRIFFDIDLPKCRGISQPCLTTIAREGEHKVLSAKWNWITRIIWVKPTDARTSCSFSLNPQVKSCLRVHDPDAFDAFNADFSRRERDRNWRSGKLNAAGDIVNDVVASMRKIKNSSQEEMDTAADEVIEEECGYESSLFDTEKQEDVPDSDDAVLQDIQWLEMEANAGFKEA